MSASQNSQLAIVSGNGRPNRPAESPAESYEAFEPLLDCEEAAALLRMHPRTLKRNARQGKIPGIQVGRMWRFRASALNRWLEAKAS
jgi:excisionase family DNA binding protein